MDHTETIGSNQRISVGHDQTLTVAHDRRMTVRNDQTLRVNNDRRVSTGHDDGLHVANDRTVTVEGNQNHSTTGDHLSRVEGSHSLTVKGSQALKVTGACGTRARGEIVLQSDTQITLRVGGSFVVIHPGGVDIVGPKINLNSGGRPGTPVGVMLPGVMEGWGDGNKYEEQNEPQAEENNYNHGDDETPDDQEEPDEDDNYYRQFHFKNDDGVPYASARYLVRYADGSKSYGITDQEGQTERFIRECAEIIDVRLLSQNIDMTEGGVDE
ncbi:bacteriophage T4 gp5 trimerisation domain-containing protein [Enterobacter sp. SA197]